MKERILKILDEFNLTSTRLADTINVQRSSISHILSGRNKPSFDFIQKILKRYPEINSRWLLLGEGNMYSAQKQSSLLFDQSGIEEDTSSTPRETDIPEYSRPNSRIKSSDEDVDDKNEVLSVEKIVIFYSNNTFEEYHPKKDK
jgi:plasmid maintenance system antidote protein VapI